MRYRRCRRSCIAAFSPWTPRTISSSPVPTSLRSRRRASLHQYEGLEAGSDLWPHACGDAHDAIVVVKAMVAGADRPSGHGGLALCRRQRQTSDSAHQHPLRDHGRWPLTIEQAVRAGIRSAQPLHLRSGRRRDLEALPSPVAANETPTPSWRCGGPCNTPPPRCCRLRLFPRHVPSLAESPRGLSPRGAHRFRT